MSTSQIIILFGLIYFINSIAWLTNNKHYKKAISEMFHSSTFIYFTGILTLVIGYILIIFYNSREMNWSVIVTIIGWIALLKGIAILIFPNSLQKFAKKLKKGNFLDIIAFSTCAIGLGLLYIGVFLAE